MAPSLYFHMSMHLLFLYFLSRPIGAYLLSPSVNPLCLEDEMSALLQFKEGYEIAEFAEVSSSPLARPKTLSWNNSRDCCSWDGIECDKNTGHVIVVDLGSSFLYGPIDNNSTLFQLAHLEKLILGDNHFNYSHIPSRVGDLSRLIHLDLSVSSFSGPVPMEIFKLTRLVYLNLRSNLDCIILIGNTLKNCPIWLEIKAPGLRTLAQNLTSLEVLLIGSVKMSSQVPDTLANLSSLRRLNMDHCNLYGAFPSAIFNLPKLQHLEVSNNEALTGRLPDFNSSSPLEELQLRKTSFSGELLISISNLRSLQIMNLTSVTYNSTGPLPESIGKLPSLSYLDVWSSEFSGSLPVSMGNLPSLSHLDIGFCKFSGPIPASFANLSNLEYVFILENSFSAMSISSFSWVWKNKKLTSLLLGRNDIYGEIPPSIGNLSQLESLSFIHAQLSGTIPSQLMNLTQLTDLDLEDNRLSGSMPAWLMNMTRLVNLDIGSNKFHGEIPSSISQLENLEGLSLRENSFRGTVELDNLFKLKNLEALHLSFNGLSCRTSSANNIFPRLRALGLASCKLSEFPAFLQNQERKEWVDLSNNNFKGEAPSWVWNSSYMQYLNLSHNFLTGLDRYFPINALDIDTIDLSYNRLTGALPPWICNLSSAVTLDLSSNNLTGVLPVCLGNISKSLMVLNLKDNKFHGSIPELFVRGTQLKMIDLSNNRLRGKLPRSLANCKMLEFINFATNFISDTFPSWLGSLPELRVLILRSNKLHGVIERPKSTSIFPKLRILDLSINAFARKLPMEFFLSLNAMKSKMGNFTYMQQSQLPPLSYGHAYYDDYVFSMTLIYKGLKLYYPKILEVLTIIDLSNNLFEGEIPATIGNLKGLQGLNLSSNLLIGHIPSALGNLQALESLDLSRNKLSGQIPKALTELGFLSFLNMSYNNLTGSVPRGKQFDTFSDGSFEGNLGLCGEFISRKCEDPNDAPGHPSTQQDEDTGSPIKLDWKIVLMGYGSGLVIGVVIGNAFISWKHVWFKENLRRRRQRSRRQPRRGRNS